MPGFELVTVAYGIPAAQALRDAVAAGKHGDPLAPVSVVVPTNYVGVAARRMLGSGALGPVTDRGVGVAGVTFLTVYRVGDIVEAAMEGGGTMARVMMIRVMRRHVRLVQLPPAIAGRYGERRHPRAI